MRPGACRAVRHQGRDLPGPHRGHEPVEIRPCRSHQGAHADRCAGRRRCGVRPVGEGRDDQGDGRAHGGQADHLRDGESRSRRSRRRRRARPAPHAIIATGRSDYPNQVNNVLGFPYIFRGALDVRASTINEAMKIAAAEALAKLAREDVPDEVHTASAGRRLTFGPDYIIPNAFDPRLISLGAAGGGARGDGERRGAQAAGRSAALCARAVGPAGSDRRRARRHHGERARPSAAAWCSPRARRRRWCAPPSPIATPAMAGRC